VSVYVLSLLQKIILLDVLLIDTVIRSRLPLTKILRANLNGLGGPAGCASSHTLAVKDFFDMQDIADTDDTGQGVWNHIDSDASIELCLFALVNTTNTLQCLLGLELVLDTSLWINIRHVAASATTGEVVCHSANVNCAPGILLEWRGNTRDDEIGAETKNGDRLLQLCVDVLDRLF